MAQRLSSLPNAAHAAADVRHGLQAAGKQEAVQNHLRLPQGDQQCDVSQVGLEVSPFVTAVPGPCGPT
jgi:hypothetical protein